MILNATCGCHTGQPIEAAPTRCLIERADLGEKEAIRVELQHRPPPAVPINRCPCEYCGRVHRSWHKYAHCRFKRGLLWVSGNPHPWQPCWALASYCRHPYPPGPCVTVTLHETLASALESKRIIDKTACGGSCTRNHRIHALHEELEG